jgi:hypothetical protein
MKIETDVIGADEVSNGLIEIPGELNADLAKVVDDRAEKLQRQWRSNARKTARTHGKRYPSSITHDLFRGEGEVYADIGPDNALPQGGMGRGFEYGSVNQTPHYDGALAFFEQEQKFVEDVLDAIGFVVD